MAQSKKERHESRIVAVKALFLYLSRQGNVSLEDSLSSVIEMEEKAKDDFAESLMQSVLENQGKIKVIVRAFAPEFTFEKIAPINRVILMLGIAELKYFDTPPIVVINEYIEIAKEFGEERSASFVNGVLDSFRKNIGKEREDRE
ncbi:transcription antitermination factor NusB [Candidatus Gracilibacteria bacterium]|nr:transcription antitermination factor NusB [Candidatus Gracilibacteria bacterium]MCF7819676.1 transcription antitermination factor NusB [Candidatus Gracilibacteria bacterium]